MFTVGQARFLISSRGRPGRVETINRTFSGMTGGSQVQPIVDGTAAHAAALALRQRQHHLGAGKHLGLNVGQHAFLKEARRQRYQADWALSAYDAEVLTAERPLADYFEACVALLPGQVFVARFCFTLVGALFGFLWFNAYPAEVFMGDVGSLSLGAILGTVALITKQEIMLILVGGLFVFEALSVIFQVGYFKITGGHRIFRMAPIHHHFELKGWPEPKVIVRFWIIAIILALMAFSTLKLR